MQATDLNGSANNFRPVFDDFIATFGDISIGYVHLHFIIMLILVYTISLKCLCCRETVYSTMAKVRLSSGDLHDAFNRS